MNPTGTTVDLAGLRSKLEGDLHAPGDAGWDDARTAWNLAVDQRPELVAVPAGPDDVVTLVRAAAEAGMEISVQATGHNASAYESLEGRLLIRTSKMRDVEIDPERRTARVGAGALWSDVVGPAGEHGLVGLQGSTHDVGVIGYSLGGGVSFLARKHGLASEAIRSVDIVTADGALRRASADEDEDLFWALRGGGGNYGVVTAIEIELLEMDRIYAGALFFPFERSREVLQAWREWTEGVPEEMTSVGRMIQFPPLPDIPEPMRGNSYSVVEVFWCGGEDAAEDVVAPLRELGPIMDTVAWIGFDALLEVHMDPPEPVPYMSGHQMLDHLDEASIDRLMDAAGPGSDTALLGYELRHAGGALARRAEGAGAMGAIEGEFMGFGVGMLPGPEFEAPLRASLERVREAMAPVANDSRYLNFAEQPIDVRCLYERDAFERLRAVKQRYDAGGLFRGNHPIEAG